MPNVKGPAASDTATAAHVGRIDECELQFQKSISHLTFDGLPRPTEAVVVFGSAYGHARLEGVGAIGDAMLHDGSQQVLIGRSRCSRPRCAWWAINGWKASVMQERARKGFQ